MDLVELMSKHSLIDQDPNTPVDPDPIQEAERAEAREVILRVIQDAERFIK